MPGTILIATMARAEWVAFQKQRRRMILEAGSRPVVA
jgi:hypothetical protein